jgi:hypothetical protein
MLTANTILFKSKHNNIHNLQMIARIADITETHCVVETLYDASGKWSDKQIIPIKDMEGFVMRRQILNDKNIDELRGVVAELLLCGAKIKQYLTNLLKE